MRRIDRLILKDIIGPWVFGVGLFSALLMAATYLGRVAGFIVDGVPPALVAELVGLLMPAILVKTFTMSVLLAALLGFGRLSSDSEIVAMKAGGASIFRMVFPVAVFSVFIAIATLAFNETFVPAATMRYEALAAEMAKSTKVKAARPIARTQVVDQKLLAAVVAENVNPATQTLQGVTMIAYDKEGRKSFLMFAKEFHFDFANLAKGGGTGDWYARGDVKIVSPDFKVVISVPDEIWPSQMPKINQTFLEFTAERDDDFDSMTIRQLRDAIVYHRRQRDKTLDVLHNYEYGYWNKFAVPLAAVAFGVLGAVLGIRNHRTGTAAGFALAVAIIFGYVTLANFMNVWAMKGVIPAWAASFAPLAIGAVASGVIMWRRNG